MSSIRRALDNYVERVEHVLLVLGFLFLGTYAYQVLAEPPAAIYEVLDVVGLVIYLVFAFDLLLRVVHSGKKLTTIAGFLDFLKHNWLSIAAVALPAFRTLRVFGVLLVIRGLAPFFRTRASRVGLIVGISLPLTLFTAAIAVLESERGLPGSNINSFGDAIWWSIASVTTVGYGDKFPLTSDGRLVASILMVVGIGLFSALTALLAAWVLGERDLKKQQEWQEN